MNTIAPIKIKSGLRVSEVLPYLETIAVADGLHIMRHDDMQMAYQKFLQLMIICEQNKLDYKTETTFCIVFQFTINQKNITNDKTNRRKQKRKVNR